MSQALPKLIVILGPTASGKTSWGLELAKKYDGEIISADSRQVYQKMNIGTAKVQGEWRWNGLRRTYFVEGIPHHLVDFLNPGKSFSAAEFRDKALKYSKIAHKNGRLPMVVGGTGLYISALVDNFVIPRVAAHGKLRQSLEEKTNEELLQVLEKLDPDAALVIDRHNKRRLIRALEVCILSGQPFSGQKKKGVQLFDILQIGIATPQVVLNERINARVDQMITVGLVTEIANLIKQSYGWNLPSMNGIGYRQFKNYFEGKVSIEETIELLKRDTRHYARRQMTWFRRDPRIKWCTSIDETEKLIDIFLQQSH
ncbi:MAG: tRNA (adenosine(37)-N6)-dimethylallyltransferase MiaA [Candidatus Magasanikbacteria bacterium RIFCSPHIGHO2_01_FULL_41_23]|uniref:tRNA dimethylallyltransferase n=1 Tax=Candidatus Magasanikbacteria bacterium RIFCSPLOWO2_01_FULL_40_15 TaxID=1798686 RepID=A0A1F6N4F8_9BACT|nr:MAG: tRNA (adenosine(37)-N6)-dimethylallyltransferase MiaA [Candidatus Magasanikbacteria bacterium RIFCSPHIGHO2_01_FULL_41_23]OGH67230.1 MAG: tRNA (adenosine(37)-N6)-dimethylallyltransferase MiaA [Candidatus Magasanikbacteria bacterium RIFCSPHIGHO2_02_FULL_41_35]OGH74587.1 MAG: tRNA (adenosine(37)-N6)-dimethylallyltransferase MiaA [Candidatus Magasanikbacteria bacterium RIFCSPHIGHO2_12_FULL_41_16]OGH78533.1 MAG: tRNA (adenosine(37)-N6)-dimethylallyltransferase MiaA [Candidatus Magasanikbacter